MSIIISCPVLGDRTAYISSGFGVRIDPITGVAGANHNGIDLQDALTWGSVMITSLAAGTVTETRNDCTWRWIDKKTLAGVPVSDYSGNYVKIDHGNGFISVYKHLTFGSVSVKKGDPVKAGQPIGQMGTTGYSTGLHLHFELLKNGIAADPEPYLRRELSVSSPAPLPPLPPVKPEEPGNVPADWAKEAVEWAIRNKIVMGDENGALDLRGPVTREQMCVFLYRYDLSRKN